MLPTTHWPTIDEPCKLMVTTLETTMSDPYDTHDESNTPDDDFWDGEYPEDDDVWEQFFVEITELDIDDNPF